MERKLAAILAADVVGYSRLMGEDEVGTLQRLKAIHKDLVKPAITQHSGRIVKLMGDGLLAEFASVVDAVECAVDIRRAMRGHEPDTAAEHRVQVSARGLFLRAHKRWADGRIWLMRSLTAFSNWIRTSRSRPMRNSIPIKTRRQWTR